MTNCCESATVSYPRPRGVLAALCLGNLMTVPIASPPPLYEQVAQKIEKLIRNGTLRSGDRIPSVRRASEQHGVSVTTTIQAYLALENRGLIEARPKSGFFVRSLLRDRMLEPKVSKPVSAVTAVS